MDLVEGPATAPVAGQEIPPLGGPMISCVIPTYNREFFLRRTIDSVLDQDYPNVECIVVDGGSTDGSVEILESYGDRIRWVSEPDNGHSDAINKGWKMARGEILAWLNADDVWAVPHAAGIVAHYFQEHPDVDLLYGDCGFIYPDGRITGRGYAHDWDLQYAVENCDPCMPQPAAFMRRSIIDKVGGLDTNLKQQKDLELWLRIGLVGTVRYVPVVLAHCSSHEGLTFDGPTMAAACPQVIQNFYRQPGVPDALKRGRRRAMSNANFRAADFAWMGGHHFGLTLRYALQGLLADPTNLGGLGRRVKEMRRRVQLGDPDSRRVQLARRALLVGTGLSMFIRSLARAAAPARVEVTPDVEREMDVLQQSWLAARIPSIPSRVLVLGPDKAALALTAAQMGHEVTAIEEGTTEDRFVYMHPNLLFVRHHIDTLPQREGYFDLVMYLAARHPFVLRDYEGRHVTDPGNATELLHRLRSRARPGGAVAICLPAAPLSDTQRNPFLDDDRCISVAHLGYDDVHGTIWSKANRGRWIASDANLGVCIGPPNDIALLCLELHRPVAGD